MPLWTITKGLRTILMQKFVVAIPSPRVRISAGTGCSAGLLVQCKQGTSESIVLHTHPAKKVPVLWLDAIRCIPWWFVSCHTTGFCVSRCFRSLEILRQANPAFETEYKLTNSITQHNPLQIPRVICACTSLRRLINRNELFRLR